MGKIFLISCIHLKIDFFIISFSFRNLSSLKVTKVFPNSQFKNFCIAFLIK